MDVGIMGWVGFNLFVLLLLALDLGVFHRKAHAVHMKEALIWSGVWIALAMLFNFGIYLLRGKVLALEFLTGYVIEKSLSVDNIFVFLMIFSYFNVAEKFQHKILFWGILGALIMRAVLIVAGAKLLHEFHWLVYIFGSFLILTGIKMLFKHEKMDPEKNPVVLLFKKIMPVTSDFHGDRFFVKLDHRWFATPLFIVLIIVESTDLIFAVDSIPAIFAVSKDPFVIYTSNVFALLGLRALYFALAGIVGLFRYLKIGLSFVLVFVGIKMMLSEICPIPILVSLVLIAFILALSIAASLLIPVKSGAKGIRD